MLEGIWGAGRRETTAYAQHKNWTEHEKLPKQVIIARMRLHDRMGGARVKIVLGRAPRDGGSPLWVSPSTNGGEVSAKPVGEGFESFSPSFLRRALSFWYLSWPASILHTPHCLSYPVWSKQWKKHRTTVWGVIAVVSSFSRLSRVQFLTYVIEKKYRALKKKHSTLVTVCTHLWKYFMLLLTFC